MKTVVVKIGSGVLTDAEGSFDKEALFNLAEDMSHVLERQRRLVIVSSGAVALGRAQLGMVEVRDYRRLKCGKKTLGAQVYASVGQPLLIGYYNQALQQYGVRCSQILVTRQDFADRDRYINLRVVVDNLLNHRIVPIFNSNDVLTGEELDPEFGNNEQVGSMVSPMVDADCMIVLTDVDGLYDSSLDKLDALVVPVVHNPLEFKVDDSLSRGKGGMRSKLLAANRLIQLGIEMRIANGRTPMVISRILAGEAIGTTFPAQPNSPSSYKTWLATAASSKGRLMVSNMLADRIRGSGREASHGSSVLLIGIEAVEGDFSEGDIVDICDIENAELLGKGKTNFSADDLRQEAERFRLLPETERNKWSNGDRVVVHLDNFVPV